MLIILFILQQVVLLILFLASRKDDASKRDLEEFVGPLAFHMTAVISDALYKLYFTVVLFTCIFRYA